MSLMRAWLIFILMIGSAYSSRAQHTSEREQLENLIKLKNEFSDSFAQQKIRAEQYALKYNIPLIQKFDNGTVIQLIDVDQFNQPVFLSTFNAAMATSLNVDELRIGGTLGLNLQGEGIEFGVWDGGPVFEHLEYNSRILTREGGTSSDHATHVAGTILASGVNQSAKGMAPLAKFHSFDWNNDRGEMASLAKPDQTGLLFSNHSYGIVQGWNCQNGSCSWTGNPGISDREDWRFGFYTTLARDIDQIAFNAPYYSIFWAAGNDRDDFAVTGAAIYPPDGNQGSGYDCISQEGTAKNIFTIGAVRKLNEYLGPTSIEMSSFSGWGPTDDGRIKPDLVAPGVSIFSTVTNNGYSSQSGTSMATPGAMGSLSLLQELYNDLSGGKYMRSATLKALAIHTAKEAGVNPGPDYSYGWGLIDTEAASKVILARDNQNVFIEELTLSNNGVYELSLSPKPNTKITATIAWTDPAGTPVTSSLDPTNLMLVNDLDMRIVDDGNNEQFPWVLNPAVASLSDPAYKDDNFRDNVEKIEFENAEPRTYKLRIKHKNQLAGGKQDFSLILTYTSLIDPQVAFYWIGGSGDWNDPSHWSLTSGGLAANELPGINNRVVIDENSFVADNTVISFSSDVSVGSIVWLNKLSAGLQFNAHSISVHGNLIFSSDKVSVLSPGRINLMGAAAQDVNQININNNDFSLMDLDVNTISKYEIRGVLKADSVNLIKGSLDITGSTLKANEFHLKGTDPKMLNLANASLLDLEYLSFRSPSFELQTQNVQLNPGENSIIDLGDKKFNGKITASKPGSVLEGNNEIQELLVQAALRVKGNNKIHALTLSANSGLFLDNGITQNLSQDLDVLTTETARARIESSTGKASLKFDGRYKLCFDYLDIRNTDIAGEAIVNAGLNSTLDNSTNWLKDNCDDILYPNFETSYNCAGGIVNLIDKSQGAIKNWKWSTSNKEALMVKENERNSGVIFPAPSKAEITLTISNDKDQRSVTQTIDVKANDLETNQIVLNGLNLFSVQSADTYEWYRDYNIISNASGRSYPYNGEPGSYFVLTKSATCNRVSNTIIITSLSESVSGTTESLEFYPNPAIDQLVIKSSFSNPQFKIVNISGQTVYEEQSSNEVSVSVKDWPRGMYFIFARDKNITTVKKLVLK